MDAGHFCDERIALRHITDGGTHLLRIARDVLTEDVRRSRSRRVKAQQCVDERSLTRTIRTKQTDRPAVQRTGQGLQDWTLAEGYA